MADVADHLIVAFGLCASAVAAAFSFLSSRKVKQVHEEVRSSNGATTAETVEQTGTQMTHVEDVVLDLRERVVELTSIVAVHLLDGHGGHLGQ